MRVRINITVDEGILKDFDDTIGIVKRSTYINEMMRAAVERTRTKINCLD